MTSPSATAYPLSWPVRVPRTQSRFQSKFGTNHWLESKRTSLATTVHFLTSELAKLGAKGVIISTNVPLTIAGMPRSGLRAPDDPGAAVYFNLNGKAIVLPCDKWRRVECNLMAIAKHIETLRGQHRWGVGTIEQAFDGYAALPAKGSQPAWYDVLKVAVDADEGTIKAAYRELALIHHPDVVGAENEAWHRLTEAYEQGMSVARGRGKQ